MAISAGLPAGPVPGFPHCHRCPYLLTGPPQACAQCAGRTLEDIGERSCPVCSQRLGGDGTCPNWLCGDTGRRIGRIHAIAYLSGPLRHKILRYKYGGAHGWALVFSRLLLGWLAGHPAGPAGPPGLIVANPTCPGPRGSRFPHTETVLDVAALQDSPRRWPFDTCPRSIVKVRPTEKSADSIAIAKKAAAQELRAALRVPDPARTAGRSILVYDDVCTTGSQLDAVAACLLDDGKAARVEAVVLARTPWRARGLTG